MSLHKLEVWLDDIRQRAAPGSVRYVGPLLVLIGILGYLWCFSNFIVDARGTPLLWGTQKHLTDNASKLELHSSDQKKG